MLCSSHWPMISTSNWGLSTGSDIQLKLMIQWIACTLHHKQLLYHPYHQRYVNGMEQIMQLMFKEFKGDIGTLW